MDSNERAKIFVENFVENYKSLPPEPENVCQFLEPPLFIKERILCSPPRGSTGNESESDLGLPLPLTIFMTKRNSERRSAEALARVSSRKSFFLRLKNLFR